MTSRRPLTPPCVPFGTRRLDVYKRQLFSRWRQKQAIKKEYAAAKAGAAAAENTASGTAKAAQGLSLIHIYSSYLLKAQQGQFTGCIAPFGYQKDPEDKNHLLVDEETAPIVRQIRCV